MPLLRDEGEVLYEGSREATYGNAYRYRVKDFAAFYISQILDIPYEIHLEPAERDAEIERLRSYVSNYRAFSRQFGQIYDLAMKPFGLRC